MVAGTDINMQFRLQFIKYIVRVGAPESEPVLFGSFGARAGAAKKLAGSSALLEDKKHKEIVLSYSSLGNAVSFYG